MRRLGVTSRRSPWPWPSPCAGCSKRPGVRAHESPVRALPAPGRRPGRRPTAGTGTEPSSRRSRCHVSPGANQWSWPALGRPSVINLWASWCDRAAPNCPSSSASRTAARRRDRRAWGRSRATPGRAAASAAEDFGITFPAVFDPDRSLLAASAAPGSRSPCSSTPPEAAPRVPEREAPDTVHFGGSHSPAPRGGGVVIDLPAWWEPLAGRAAVARRSDFTRWPTPPVGGRRSAVLVLLGEQPATGPDVLLLQRAATLRNHAGQPAFPGGAADPGDVDAPATAMREAVEEVGLDPNRPQSSPPCRGCGSLSADTS